MQGLLSISSPFDIFKSLHSVAISLVFHPPQGYHSQVYPSVCLPMYFLLPRHSADMITILLRVVALGRGKKDKNDNHVISISWTIGSHYRCGLSFFFFALLMFKIVAFMELQQLDFPQGVFPWIL